MNQNRTLLTGRRRSAGSPDRCTHRSPRAAAAIAATRAPATHRAYALNSDADEEPGVIDRFAPTT
jgi:hypothetical protein